MLLLVICIIVLSAGLWSVSPVLTIFLWGAIILALVVSSQKTKEQEKVNAERHKDILDGKSGITPTKSLKCRTCPFAIYIDEKAKKILVANLKTDDKRTIPFENVVECSILENGATVQSGGVGRAIVGGALAGGVGAIVGATTRGSHAMLSSLSVRIVTKDISNALCEIPIIKSETKRDSDEAKEAISFSQQIYATIISIIDSKPKANSADLTASTPTPTKPENLHQTPSHNQLENSSIEILKQLADLRDKGILTEAEFTAKKREILGLNSSEE